MVLTAAALKGMGLLIFHWRAIALISNMFYNEMKISGSLAGLN